MRYTENFLHEIFCRLNDLETPFISEVKLFLQIGENRNLYTMDLFTSTVINRSIALMRGFVTLSKDNNYIASIPLIMLQIDNCLRFYAATIVPDYNDFFISFLGGEHIRNIKDASGFKMTDAYLVTKMNNLFPGIKMLYKNTSAHVHLSNEHSFLQTKLISRNERTIETRVGNYDFYSIDDKVDFAYNMLKASEILLDITRSWKFQKLKGEEEMGKKI